MRKRNTMFGLSKTAWWFITGFLFAFIVSIVLLNSYIGVEINGMVVMAYAFISLIVALIFAGSARGKTHFGHFPFLLGLVLSFWAGTALLGNLEITTLGKGLWWTIEDKGMSRNLGIIWFVGVLFFVAGLKMIAGNLFFLRPFGKR